MRRDLLEVLRCPMDQGELALAVTTEDPAEVLEGTLTCQRCGEVYPIKEAIPRMLPPDLRRELEKRLRGT